MHLIFMRNFLPMYTFLAGKDWGQKESTVPLLSNEFSLTGYINIALVLLHVDSKLIIKDITEKEIDRLK